MEFFLTEAQMLINSEVEKMLKKICKNKVALYPIILI